MVHPDMRSCRRAAASTFAIVLVVGALPGLATAQTGEPPAVVPGETAGQQPETVATPDAASSEAVDGGITEVVVTGFRASINNALALKKQETGVVDTILAEDIGKFPDSNLAESMQRVPGVALARGDGGEGKQISVRGLGANFTRVRLNGMEGTSQTGSSDIFGAGNRSRGFDFNVFASELFNALTVRKTSEAQTEEGSLGATVDLQTARPLSYKQDFVLAGTAQNSYNDLADKNNPRITGLISKHFADDTVGVLGSVAYTKRNTREEGYSAVNILPGTQDGGFCSPVGYSSQSPASNPAKGTDANNCATGIPRTSDPTTFAAVNRANVFLPRLPRYVRSDQDYNRLGATAALQWHPNHDTQINLDGLYSRFDVTRYDNYISALSFGRAVGANGKPHTSVLEASVTPDGTVEYGKFNGVDVRSEGLIDHFISTFKQVTLSGKQVVTDRFQVDALLGRSRSMFDNPMRTTISIDAINANGYSYDFRNGGNIPNINFGLDVTDPNNFRFQPASANGDVQGFVTMRRLQTVTDNTTAEVNGLFEFNDNLKARFGIQHRESDFDSRASGRSSANANTTPALPAGTTLASLTRSISGFGDGLSGNLPSAWAAADYDKFNDVFHISDEQGIFALVGPEGGVVADNSKVKEQVRGAYTQLEFDTDLLPVRLRGNVGVRYVRTKQSTLGYVPLGTSSSTVTASRSYDDWLPSATLTADLREDLLLRAAVAKVIARPDLGQLTPGLTGFAAVQKTMSGGNPALDPIRANTADLSLEYYFGKGGLLSGGVFYKDIKTYIQTLQSQQTFADTGLPDSLLTGTGTLPSELFTVTRFENTKGGPLKGVELNYQQPFTFLPGVWSKFGVLTNYTYVTSTITYITPTTPPSTTKNDLVGLSKNAYSGTLYYEDGKLSARTTASYRGKYLRAVPSGGPNSDVLGTRATTFVDAAASYQLTDALKITVEAQNLTDENNSLYIDSARQDSLFDTHNGRTLTVGIAYRL